MLRWLSVGLFILASGLRAQAAEPIVFNRDIRPLLSDKCFACHGPDKNHREAGLRLDLRDAATSKLESETTAIVPGKPDDSELIRRIASTDPDDRMPPGEHVKPLTPQQVDTFRRWIAEGAVYQDHWSFTPVVRPALPEVAGVPHPVDRFIQARLAKEKLFPAKEADKRTLIRRLTFDLHGLPPTEDEIHAFVNDESSNAFEKVVDRLLASPRFAERQAMFWLDAVRYADSVGFHGDQWQDVWPYRDYVLKAFHENKPFDEFTREQLAGDLLPNATRDQKVASAFNRLNRMTAEGGAQDKEYLAKYAADRVRTIGIAWLGLTTGCAECHDHKFDPVTLKDFYALEAFFADIDEQGFYGGAGPTGEWGPLMTLTTPEQDAQLARYDEELAQIKKLRDSIPEEAIADGQKAWEDRLIALDAARQLNWVTVTPTSLSTKNGAELVHEGNGQIVARGPNPDRETYTVSFKPGAGEWAALRLQIDSSLDLPGSNVGRGWVGIMLSELEIDIADGAGAPRPLAISEAVCQEPKRGRHGFPAFAAVDGDPATGFGSDRGTPPNRLVVRFRAPLKASEETVLTVRLRHESQFRRATIGRFRLALSHLEGATMDDSGVPEAVIAVLRKKTEDRNKKDKKAVADFYRILGPGFDGMRQREDELKARRGMLLETIPATLVTVSRNEPRPIRVLPRGNWMDDSGEIVKPDVPNYFGSVAKDETRATRLDLANWLVDSNNPLTARVFANRTWRQFFGTGLSKNLDDVGSQGEWPSHPELLDWLASEFMHPTAAAEGTHPWDVKHLVRTIVTSHAYRQSSVADDKTRQRDLDNRLLARQTPIRLDAESIRDNALAISGLLHNEFGGPSVFPIQPGGYWAALNFPKREYAASYGDELHRRSVYTHWQRTFVHPTLLVFDAATREECTVQRATSNTPLQALTVLNDPIFIEAAKAFATRALQEGGAGPEARVAWAFQQAAGRVASDEERGILTDLYRKQLARFEKSPKSATELVGVDGSALNANTNPIDLAAMTSVTRAILNLSESITRD
ncbi:Planctomycete cytochrome C [Caulifigura coniformis]|uniref:Planctomycete cytochrome C n=1 Tax=Caulifigura coniformis TaxID=2527983 RepID=A0A517SN18_9PLAN|nr:PSD1 and planctomycete cytochrome C domain-containing protein [Caulifigura coniformis]QDT57496.1 Planctomycete cytochrome C [Caulifigura coniformis]